MLFHIIRRLYIYTLWVVNTFYEVNWDFVLQKMWVKMKNEPFTMNYNNNPCWEIYILPSYVQIHVYWKMEI